MPHLLALDVQTSDASRTALDSRWLLCRNQVALEWRPLLVTDPKASELFTSSQCCHLCSPRLQSTPTRLRTKRQKARSNKRRKHKVNRRQRLRLKKRTSQRTYVLYPTVLRNVLTRMPLQEYPVIREHCQETNACTGYAKHFHHCQVTIVIPQLPKKSF
jgi:hypothetical protein